MLLLRSSPTSMFIGSSLAHLEATMRTETHPNISLCAGFNPHPCSLGLFRDLLDSEDCRSETQDSRYTSSSLQHGSNGVPLFCTSRGCRSVQVSEGDYMSRGSGRGGNCEAPEDENSKNSIDKYYQRMLEANPGNPLLLSNYAKFLHEVEHNMTKAEEYYGRAILANPGDAEVLSLYAKLIWETHKESSRAKVYFDRAVKAAPDNCYILSAYAHFLWDSDEDEDDRVDQQNVTASTCLGSMNNEAVT